VCTHATPCGAAAAGLLQALGPACCTLSAAFQQQQQQQQHDQLGSRSQQQQQQQHVTMTALGRISFVCLAYYWKGILFRNETATAAAAAAAAGATSSRQSSRTDDRSGQEPEEDFHDCSWLLPDPASATELPAVAQLAVDMLQSPITSSLASSSSARSHSASTAGHVPYQNVPNKFGRSGNSSSSTGSGVRHENSTQHHLQRWPATRSGELALVGKIASVISVSVGNLDEADSRSLPVQALLAEPQLQQLLLLDMALAVQAVHQQQQGVAPMPAVAAAVAAALPYSCAAHEQQQQGKVEPWHEELLLVLGVPPDELAAVAAATATAYGNDLDSADRACIALDKCLDIRQRAAHQLRQAEQ
jgi:hypothetical protein